MRNLLPLRIKDATATKCIIFFNSSSSFFSPTIPGLDLFTLCPSAGHSRSIVGFEQKKNGSLCLLLLDPGSSLSDTRKLLNRDTVSTAVCHIRKFSDSMTHTQYQVVVVQGVLSSEEKQVSCSGMCVS